MPGGSERRDRPLKVFAFDPSFGPSFGNHLLLRLPYEPVEPGPKGRYVHVVDDPAHGAVELDDDAILLGAGLPPSEFDARFHQQMVYAVATHAIDLFQNSLGRAIDWPWDGPLRISPHAGEADVVFDPGGSIHLGHLPATADLGPPGRRVHACVSFDLVMGAVVRALLAAVGRPDNGGGEPDGWSAGMADLLALLHHFTRIDAVLECVRRTSGRLHDPDFLPDLEPRAARPAIQAEVVRRNPLLQLAPQFARARAASRGGDSRHGTADGGGEAPDLAVAPFVGAVLDALFTVYTQRSADLVRIAEPRAGTPGLHPDLAHRMAREAVKSARRFLVMCIRAVDYCPPGPVAPGDYLRALVTVSADFAPEREDDREALIGAFRARHVTVEGARSYTEEGLRWPPAAPPAEPALELTFHRRTPEEREANAAALAGFLPDHREALGLDPDLPVTLDGLPDRYSERLATNGSVRREAVVWVSQPGGPRAALLIGDDGTVRYALADRRESAPDPPGAVVPAQAPTVRPLEAYAFDPSQGDRFGNRLVLQVPYERLEPGPVGRQLAVIDYDAANDCYYTAVDLDDVALLGSGMGLRDDDPRFHQQMVYAVASETIRRFEFALGRQVKWPWTRRTRKDPVRNRLRILPHAFQEPNAYYDREIGSLVFGYFLSQPGDEVVFTCLSHDIVVHETAHALVDTVRPLLLEATGPDALAFHEAFADIVALLQHFSHREALYETVLRTGGRIHAGTLAPESAPGDEGPSIEAELSPSNPLVQVAKQFGEAMGTRKALREAIGTPPGAHRLDTVVEPHERGSILVAAVFDAFFTVYVRRTADLLRLARAGRGLSPWGDLHPDLAARLTREAAKTARHFLTICVRALDYLPPVDVTFGDFLRAVLTSDADIVPDDQWRYRSAFVDAFRSRGIRTEGVSGTSEAALRWHPVEDALVMEGVGGRSPFLGQASQVARRLHRFAEEHRERLNLDPDSEVPVQAQRFHLQDSRRVDPISGLRQQEFVAQFVQRQEIPVDPADPGAGTVPFRGGSTVLFWADGRVRYVISRPFHDEVRARRQREYLRQMRMNLAAAPFVADAGELDLARLHRGW